MTNRKRNAYAEFVARSIALGNADRTDLPQTVFRDAQGEYKSTNALASFLKHERGIELIATMLPERYFR